MCLRKKRRWAGQGRWPCRPKEVTSRSRQALVGLRQWFDPIEPLSAITTVVLVSLPTPYPSIVDLALKKESFPHAFPEEYALIPRTRPYPKDTPLPPSSPSQALCQTEATKPPHVFFSTLSESVLKQAETLFSTSTTHQLISTSYTL